MGRVESIKRGARSFFYPVVMEWIKRNLLFTRGSRTVEKEPNVKGNNYSMEDEFVDIVAEEEEKKENVSDSGTGISCILKDKEDNNASDTSETSTNINNTKNTSNTSSYIPRPQQPSTNPNTNNQPKQRQSKPLIYAQHQAPAASVSKKKSTANQPPLPQLRNCIIHQPK